MKLTKKLGVGEILDGAIADLNKSLAKLEKASTDIEKIRQEDEQQLEIIQARVLESDNALERLGRIRERVVEFFS